MSDLVGGSLVLPLWGELTRSRADRSGERGMAIFHSTIYRWVQKFAPEIEKRLRCH